MSVIEKQRTAEADHSGGMNCAQSVLKQFCPMDLQVIQSALKISSGFGGGMKMSSVCGALSGGIMALGLNLGSDDPKYKGEIEAPVRDLISRFTEAMSYTDCQDIIGYDVNIPSQRELAISQGIMEKQCALAINTAIQIVDEILKERL